MIVNRRTFNIKPGHMEEVTQLIFDVIKAINMNSGANHPKLLTAVFGPFDLLVMETEHADLGQYEKDWNETFAHPAFEPFWPKWFELTAGGGSNEVWEVLSPKE